MNGQNGTPRPVCGNTWCTARHPAHRRVNADICRAGWRAGVRSKYEHCQMAVDAHPSGNGHEVFLQLAGCRNFLHWPSRPKRMERDISAWVTPDEARALGEQLIAVADAADKEAALQAVQPQNLSEAT